MPTLSQMTAAAHANHQAVMKKFEAVRALDNNPLFDQDPAEGSVVVQVDSFKTPESIEGDYKPSTFTAHARFQADGTPIEMDWKTTRRNDFANKEMDAPVVEYTASIKTEGDNTTFGSTYYGPTEYGEFERSEKQLTTLNSATGTLVDFGTW